MTRLLDGAAAHPGLRVGAVTGRLVRRLARAIRRRLDACGMRLTRNWRHLDRGSGEVDRGQLAVPERVFGATGAASLFRRAALDDVAVEGEIFDSRFHSFREDAELCFRLRERGWEVLYEPAAVCEHRRFNLPERRSAMPARSTSTRSRTATCCGSTTRRRGTSSAPSSPPWPATWRRSAGCCCASARSLAAYAWLWRNRREIRRRRRLIQGRRTVPAGGDRPLVLPSPGSRL